MKVTVNVDRTAEETRTFLGRPDVQPMQAAVLAEMDRFSPVSVMKRWMSLFPQSPEHIQEAFARMFQQGFSGGKPPAK